jgi:two-component system chemotaxis response regulator CheB
VKRYGGTAIVQDPDDAVVSSMPKNALQEVQVDHCVPAIEMASLLANLSQQKPNANVEGMKDEQTKKEIEIAAGEYALKKNIFKYGKLTPYTCPECQGVLSQLNEGDLVRYRCHTGHAYSADALMLSLTENIEDNLYKAMRGMDEAIMLLNHIGDRLAEANQPRPAAVYFQKAKEAEERSQLLRKAILKQEHLSGEIMLQQAGKTNDDK